MDNNTTPPTANTDNQTPVEPTPPEAVDIPEPVTSPEPPAEPEVPTIPPVVADHGSKKRGLKAALITLLVLLLAAASAGAVYMWQQSKVDDLNAQLKTAKTASTNKPATTTPTTSANPDLTKSTALVKSFYTEYNKDVGNGSSKTDSLIAKYGNSNLAFYKKYYNFGFDPIICAQDVLPDTFTVSGSKSEKGVATVLVKVSDTDSIKVRVVDQGGLKVDGITCYGDAANVEPHPVNN